jgi:hypothetical protein
MQAAIIQCNYYYLEILMRLFIHQKNDKLNYFNVFTNCDKNGPHSFNSASFLYKFKQKKNHLLLGNGSSNQ